MRKLVDVWDCPCNTCRSRRCEHTDLCTSFQSWKQRTVDAVPADVYKHVLLERDRAIELLKQHGIPFDE